MSQSRYALFFSNTLANAGFQLFTMVLNLVVTPLFVGKMGAELYGIWILNFTIMGFLGVIDSGVPAGIVKHISQARGSQDYRLQTKVIHAALAGYVLLGAATCLVTLNMAEPVLGIFNITPENRVLAKHLLWISGGFALLLYPLKVFTASFEGLLAQVTLNFVKGTFAVLNSGALILTILLAFPLEIVLSIFYGIESLSGVCLVLLTHKRIPGFRLLPARFDRELFGSIMKFGLQLTILEVIALCAFQVDHLIIAYFLPVTAVATYAIVTKLFYQLRKIYGLLLSVVTPFVFEAHHRNDHAFIERMVLKGTKYVNMGYIPLITLAMVISTPFLTLWVGEPYGSAGGWSTFFLSQYLVSPVIGVIGTVGIGMSKVRAMQVYGVIAAAFNVLFSIIAVQFYGFAGVLIGTVASTYLGIWFIYPHYCRYVKIPWTLPVKHNWKISAVLILGFLVPGLYIVQGVPFSWPMLIFFSGGFLSLEYIAMYLFFVEQEEKTAIAHWISPVLMKLKWNA
jgi:O-antigen/teichoic acid export membrane protein